MSTVFAYGPGGQILAERRLRSDGTRELEWEYLWLDSLPIAMAERSYAADGTTVTASQFVYLHADHLDTPRLATDAAQRVVWRWRSDAFGIGAAETDPDGDSIETEVSLRFPGQYHDAETELHYNYFRDYDPTLGRYVQSDLIGLGGGINTYAYAEGDPIALFDALGLAVCQRRWHPWGEHIQLIPLPEWQTLPTCRCYWMCVPCRGPWVWSGNRATLPSTKGTTIVVFSSARRVNTGSGGIRPTPRGPAGGPSGTMGGSYACIGCEKPGPESDCNDGKCYADSNFTN